MARELNFTLEGVQGNLKLEYGPFKQRLYQDGREIKRQGRFNPKYHITNTNGEQEEIKIVYGLDFVHVAVFRGRKIDLEERLSTREYIVGGLPVLLILLGGLIGALFGIIGATFNYNYMRKEKSFVKQLLVSLVVSVACYIAYFILAICLQLLVVG
ncbi:hypothetical protein [uncultured Phocaeicola sp.]|jgi:hypothetical protein|uniref:hypothetical protein n=1 Tax=uncultured Phocaeicola sp. TaxID=990718 RepID=UPI002582C8C5|nr:hypothetical protein [uncultured Phocaeicola sp.]